MGGWRVLFAAEPSPAIHLLPASDQLTPARHRGEGRKPLVTFRPLQPLVSTLLPTSRSQSQAISAWHGASLWA